jgi:hypothetical protein
MGNFEGIIVKTRQYMNFLWWNVYIKTMLESWILLELKQNLCLCFVIEFLHMWMMKLCENVLESVMNIIVLSFEP